MAYDMRDPFIIPTLLYDYSGAVEDHWGNRATTGVYLLSHWSKFLLRVVEQFQIDSYMNWNNDEYIVSCERTKDIFVNSPDPTLIKRVGDKYETLYEIDWVGGYLPQYFSW